MTPTRKAIGWTARRKKNADSETAYAHWFHRMVFGSESRCTDIAEAMKHNWGLSAAEKREFGA